MNRDEYRTLQASRPADEAWWSIQQNGVEVGYALGVWNAEAGRSLMVAEAMQALEARQGGYVNQGQRRVVREQFKLVPRVDPRREVC